MKINLLEQSDLLWGASQLIADEDGFYPARMTEELTEHYSTTEAFCDRAACTGGIRVSFYSDSDFIAIGLRYGVSCRPVFKADLVIDRMECITFGPDEFQENFYFSTGLSGSGERRIDIFLPYSAEVRIEFIEVDDDSVIRPVESREHKMLFIGDSITQGMTASSPSRIYATMLGEALDVDYQNIAVGGAKMEGKVGELALEIDWDMALVAFGVNDFACSFPPETVKAETELMLKNLTQRENASIFVVTPVAWVGRTEPNEHNLALDDYRALIKETAEKFPGVQVIDGCELVPDDAAYFVDNVHPDDLGFRSYCDNLLPLIKIKQQ